MDAFRVTVWDTIPRNEQLTCYECDEKCERQAPFEWKDNQTRLDFFKCARCTKNNAVKIFGALEIKVIKNVTTPSMKYYTYVTTDTRCRQGKGKCEKCDGPIYCRVIDQSKFINNEVVECQKCHARVELSCASPTALDINTNVDGKVKTIGQRETKAKRRKRIAAERRKNTEAYNIIEAKQAEIRQVKELELRNSFQPLLREVDMADLTDTVNVGEGNDTDTSSLSISSTNSRKRRNKPKAITERKKSRIQTSGSGLCESTKGVMAPPLTSSNKIRTNEDVRTPIAASHSANEIKNVPKRQEHNTRSNGVNQASSTLVHKNKIPTIFATNPEWLESTTGMNEAMLIAKEADADFCFDKRSGKFMFKPRTLEARNKIKFALEHRNKAEYYTHGTREERRPSKKFVAKGVYTGTCTESDIIENIGERYGLTPERAIVLRNAALLLVFRGDADSREIRSITTILYQCVKIEKYKVKMTAVTQCKRCLDFGHVQAHCGRTKKEDTIAMMSNDSDALKVVCSNCNEEGHTARQAKCPLFHAEIERQRERRQKFNSANVKPKKSDVQQQKAASAPDVQPGVSYADRTSGPRDIPSDASASVSDALKQLPVVLTEARKIIYTLNGLMETLSKIHCT